MALAKPWSLDLSKDPSGSPFLIPGPAPETSVRSLQKRTVTCL